MEGIVGAKDRGILFVGFRVGDPLSGDASADGSGFETPDHVERLQTVFQGCESFPIPELDMHIARRVHLGRGEGCQDSLGIPQIRKPEHLVSIPAASPEHKRYSFRSLRRLTQSWTISSNKTRIRR